MQISKQTEEEIEMEIQRMYPNGFPQKLTIDYATANILSNLPAKRQWSYGIKP